ncbi:androgen-induced protein [Cricetulus griseus]|nr:androgen-induced protein [Cricetulus griseus]
MRCEFHCITLAQVIQSDIKNHENCFNSGKTVIAETDLHQVIQAVFFGICVLTDLSTLLTRDSGNQEQERQLRKLISLRDWTLAVLAFPVGVFVVAVFWTIYAYDREMIYPKLLDNFIPGWLNHGMVSLSTSPNHLLEEIQRHCMYYVFLGKDNDLEEIESSGSTLEASKSL